MSACLVRSVIAVGLVVAAAAPVEAAPLLSVRASLFALATSNPIQLGPNLGPGSTGTDNNSLFPVDINPAQGRLERPATTD